MSDTNFQYDEVISKCRDTYIRKTKDYGTSWRVFRLISITDQIYIKALRIRTIQEKGVQKVNENIEGEFAAMVNYGIMGLIQMSLPEKIEDLPLEIAVKLYDEKAAFTKNVMEAKNHDYGEAWRDMSQQSFVDLILVKLLRIRQIISNDGKTLISEGIDANFVDIINYSVFALILTPSESLN
ncbi:MAG: DUF1599 domain-containing protein [Chitinophagaceae bacterium]|nr:MAG: DUF1599 domain-containing protein [Chitinophagaceae bacterium]